MVEIPKASMDINGSNTAAWGGMALSAVVALLLSLTGWLQERKNATLG
jgi:hypothetical protein